MRVNFGQSGFLVTGGTGSFGRTMVEHLLKTPGGRIRVFSRDEAKQDAMRQEINDARVEYYIGDVRDYRSVRAAMEGFEYVFHAAALKQVPSCERYPEEAVKTNVLGADNVMRAAVGAKVLKCVLLSTDKAVYPVSAMGTSKAMMEKLMLAYSQRAGNTVLCATRYGNVMNSRGSVIPLFCQQIKAGRPMTITNRDMTRFLMSLEEAVQLVMFAFEHATAGDILVELPAACSAYRLAGVLRMMSGTPPVSSTIIGTRPGEKLHEYLMSVEESSRAMLHTAGRYWRIPAAPVAHCSPVPHGYSSDTARQLSKWELVDLLKQLPCVQEIMR